MKLDSRFTFDREYTGHISGKPQYVARFVGERIGASSTRAGAVKLATKWNAKRDPAYPPYPRGKNKIRKVMTEFESGKLRSSSGRKVTSLAQARAIALSEQRAAEKRRPAKRKTARDCACTVPKQGAKRDCGCHGAKRDFAPIRKIKKKIAIYRLKLALRSLWEGGSSMTEKAKNVVERAKDVALLSGLTPEQVARIEQEVIGLATEGLALAREAANRRLVRPAMARTKRLTTRTVTVTSRDASKRTCGMSTEIQTLVLSQQMFTERQAVGWAKRHGFRVIKVDVTPNNYRFRQHPPSNFEPGSFRTIRLRAGVEAVIGCPN